jgi:hypothetical protein
MVSISLLSGLGLFGAGLTSGILGFILFLGISFPKIFTNFSIMLIIKLIVARISNLSRKFINNPQNHMKVAFVVGIRQIH